jgi:hypothetical protein
MKTATTYNYREAALESRVREFSDTPQRVRQDCLDGSDVLDKPFAPVVAFDKAYDAPEP